MSRLLAFGLVIALPIEATCAEEPRRPNVLFIAVDDLNDWVGCLGGHPQAKTPNIDRLAARGTLFTNAHCNAPLCNPSRTSVLTGLLPSTSGVHGNEQDWHKSPYLKGRATLPRWFHDHGYATAACGKVFHANHGGECGAPNGGHGGLQGFDDFPAWDERFPAKDRQLVRDAVLPGQNFNGLDIWHWDWGPIDVADDETADGRAVSWAEERIKEEHDKPFFLAAGIYRPHSPMYVPRAYFDAQPAPGEIVLPESPADDLDDVPLAGKGWVGGPGDYHPLIVEKGLWDDAVRGYLANVKFADAMVGRLLDALDASPRGKETVVVLWGDHGWHLGEKRRWHKSTLWEEATRVPLIVVAPDVTGPGGRSARAVSLVDLYPTLCELCALPVPGGLDGASLVPLLRDPKAGGHPPAVTILGGRHAAVRTDRWRLTRYGDGSEELYDHDADPNEWKNLAGDQRYADVKVELARHLPEEIRTYKEDLEFPNEPGFRPIFNGADLTGWTAAGNCWKVEGGSIAGESEGRNRGRLEWSGSRTRDFELRVRFRGTDDAFLVFRREPAVGLETITIRRGDGRWHDFTFTRRGEEQETSVDGRPVGVGNGEVAGAVRVSFEPPTKGRIELTDLRLRDLSGR